MTRCRLGRDSATLVARAPSARSGGGISGKTAGCAIATVTRFNSFE